MSCRILVGDVRARLADLESGSVQCVVTSPPYFGLRTYLPDEHEDKHHEIGLERTLADYIATMVDVFREVRRVLHPTGTVWINCGDSYHDKQLMMIPARLAIALQEDGYYLRSDIIWHKKAPMPESVTDRPTSAHEHIFLLTKSPKYFYDADAVAEPSSGLNGGGFSQSYAEVQPAHGAMVLTRPIDTGTRNQRNVWTLGPESFPDAHFAVFPTEIPRRAIRAGTSEKGACAACGAPWGRVIEREFKPLTDRSAEKMAKGSGNKGLDDSNGWGETPRGTVEVSTTGWSASCACDAGIVPCVVLDPFFGSGTTGLVADQLGRDCIGIELNPHYAGMSHQRVYGAAPLFAKVSIA